MLKLTPYKTVEATNGNLGVWIFWDSKGCSKASPPKASLLPTLLRNALYNITGKAPCSFCFNIFRYMSLLTQKTAPCMTQLN